MNVLSLSILTVALYASASFAQSFSLASRTQRVRYWVLGLGFVAVMLHSILLYRWIDLSIGQNLTVFNMLSLIAWLISFFVLLVALFKPIDVLAVFIFPIAILSILLVLGFPGQFILMTDAKPINLFHIVLSVITFAILCMAGLQAILLALQERTLRLKPSGTFIHRLPPLETMEKLLFQMVSTGFVFLSLLLVSSVYFFYAELLTNKLVFQKTTLVVFAWAIFAVLLLGHYLWGWRGRKAVYCTLYGVILLLIVYLGSKLVS